MINDALECLINEGCPSIAYRARKEIRQNNISGQEFTNYQDLIYSEPKVQKILFWQGPDGYFGTRLHTAPSKSKVWTHEGCVRYLIEMGLTKENENVRKALEVMLYSGWGKECENSRASNVFKYEMIRASLFAQSDHQEHEIVAEWVEDALQGFRNIADAESVYDLIYERSDGKRFFREGKFIPTIYHLRLLAFTDPWRTESNLKMVERAYQKLYQWLPLPPMYYKYRSQMVAPLGSICLALNQDFNKDFGFFWLHFYEMSARMGMLGEGSPFRKHFEKLKENVLKQHDIVMEYTKAKKGMYVNWSGYSGIALEGEWKTAQQRIRDFVFRVLLIDKYSDRTLCRTANKCQNGEHQIQT